MKQMKTSKMGNKPESVLKTIVTGKMDKFYSEIVFLEQTFALPENKEQEVKICKLIENEAKRLQLKPTDVVRYIPRHHLIISC